MRAWEGPFASAGAASVIAAAMLMAAESAVTAVSLRNIGRLLPSAVHFCYTAGRCRVPAPASARRPGDGERGCLAKVAFQPQRDLPGSPDQCVAGGEPGGGYGGCAVAGDVHQVVRALDPQALGAVHLDPGHVAQLNELLEVGLVQVAGEFIYPYQAVRCPAVDQGYDPPAVADHDVARPAERRRYQDGEGDTVAGLFQRRLPLAGQGG